MRLRRVPTAMPRLSLRFVAVAKAVAKPQNGAEADAEAHAKVQA